MSALLLRGRLLAARLLIVASVALLAACQNVGTVNWTVTQTTDAPAAVASPSVCPAGATLDPPPGCGPAPSSSPTPAPTGPDGKDYVPFCLPTDPPGSYCQAAPQ